FGHAKDGAGEKRVLAASELGMEAGADFEKRTDASVNFGPAGGRSGNSGQDLQERRFAGAVAADEAEDFAFTDVERDVFEGVERLVAGTAEDGKRGFDGAFESVPEAGIGVEAAAVELGERFSVDDGGHGVASAACWLAGATEGARKERRTRRARRWEGRSMR